MKNYRDPREQDVIPMTPDSVEAAMEAHDEERVKSGYPAQLTPLRQALTGNARDGICSACGIPVKLHFGVTGSPLGCDVAQYVRRQSTHPRNPERWNDCYASVTAVVRAAMVDGTCGPRFEIEMAGYSNDEQLTLAATLARIAITEYIRGLAK
jgi:hypothetical protein